MEKIKYFLLLVVLCMPFMVSAQKAGYQAYQRTAFVQNGQRSAGAGTVWVKFDGNHVFLDMGLPMESRYVYAGKQDNGNSLYYLEVYNYGTINQGSGYIQNRDSWLLVSPDKKTLNAAMNNGNNITVYRLQDTNSAGDMIY